MTRYKLTYERSDGSQKEIGMYKPGLACMLIKGMLDNGNGYVWVSEVTPDGPIREQLLSKTIPNNLNAFVTYKGEGKAPYII